MLNRPILRWLASALLTLPLWLVGVTTAAAQGTASDAAKRAAGQAAEQAAKQAAERPAHVAPRSTGVATAPGWNEPFRPIANIDWVTPVNPSYVNLGDDLFLFGTRQGIQQWDFATLQLHPLKFSDAAGVQRLERLAYGNTAWARLGAARGSVGAQGLRGASTGTVFVAVTHDRAASLLWWNPADSSIAASLSIPGQADDSKVLQIAPNYALLCDFSEGASVVKISRRGEAVTLEWATDGDPLAKSALLDRGVVGSVKGFGSLVAASGRGSIDPVFYDASRCGWEMRNPPPDLRTYLDKATRSSLPIVKPYFLSDGSVLVPEISYHDGKYPRNLQSALLWAPGATKWKQLEATRGGGNVTHRGGQTEPVLAVGSESSVVEFFDVATLQWVRSVESLNISPYQWYPRVQLEPLSSGKALVILSDHSYPGTVGVMTPARGDIPRGKLLTPRWMFGEVVLPGGQMLLLGGENHWHPTGRVELIDMAQNQSRARASLPAGSSLSVDPSGVSLPDGSVLVFAGLPVGCSPGYYIFGDGACANRSGLPSTRYWPDIGRMASLPNLKIPFSWGANWQTGNSELMAQWPRSDVVIRPDGRLVWLEGADFPERKDREDWPRVTQLKVWSHQTAELPARDLAKLRKARSRATLINLNDGRLAAVGGEAQLELVALEKDCLDCPDEFVSIGPLRAARSTEIFDETDAKGPSWKTGPLAHFGGGKAFKLDNGRIFKLSLTGVFDEEGYQAEVADAAFTAWTKLPKLPKPPMSQTSPNEPAKMLINNVAVIGNRVLILTDQNHTIVWDDDKGAWLKWTDWPGKVDKELPFSINRSPEPNKVFLRYRQSFVTMAMPAPP